MSLSPVWTWLESLPIAADIGGSWWFPLFESIHVLASTFVVGSILMVDLRLLGLAARRYPVSRVTREIVPWTIGACAVSALAGLGMFISQASRYMDNRAFQVKLVLLLLAAVNMAIFHLRTSRGIAKWDMAGQTSPAAKLGGACSLLLWIGIVLSGRWIGHLL
jgi:hypothetical protein